MGKGKGNFPRRSEDVHSFIDRFEIDNESVVYNQTHCWKWIGTTSERGYGYFFSKNVRYYAHRWSYIYIGGGVIPDGYVIDHLCRNHCCVHPGHLEAVTSAENILRGFGAPANNYRKNECINGHPFSDENTRNRRGSRDCLVCVRIGRKNYKMKKKQKDRMHRERPTLTAPMPTDPPPCHIAVGDLVRSVSKPSEPPQRVTALYWVDPLWLFDSVGEGHQCCIRLPVEYVVKVDRPRLTCCGATSPSADALPTTASSGRPAIRR